MWLLYRTQAINVLSEGMEYIKQEGASLASLVLLHVFASTRHIHHIHLNIWSVKYVQVKESGASMSRVAVFHKLC